MARKPRFTLPGITQHVVQRGSDRQACFLTEADYQFYLECLGNAASQYGCQVHAYVLMPNHIHLLLTPLAANSIALTMQAIGRRYVPYFNRTYQRQGALWEGRYRASLVDTETYLLCCLRYVELNPVRAELVSHPREYRWSSYHANAGYGPDPLITPHAVYLELGDDSEERQMIYRSLFEEEVGDRRMGEIRTACRQGLPLGSETFKDQLEKVLSRPVRPGRKGRPKKREGRTTESV